MEPGLTAFVTQKGIQVRLIRRACIRIDTEDLGALLRRSVRCIGRHIAHNSSCSLQGGTRPDDKPEVFAALDEGKDKNSERNNQLVHYFPSTL
jgi:hypothetical protein